MFKKSLRPRIISVMQIITILLVVWVIWQSLKPVQDAGDGIALGIFALVVVAPLYIVGTLLAIIFARTKKHIALILIPILCIASAALYDRMTHISYFNPADYQHLVGKNISETRDLFQKASGGTGEVWGNDTKWYTLPGMTLWVDKDENIITINSDN